MLFCVEYVGMRLCFVRLDVCNWGREKWDPEEEEEESKEKKGVEKSNERENSPVSFFS